MTKHMIRTAALALLVCLPGLVHAQGAAPAAVEGATRPQRMTPEAREQARQRWQAMSADERQKAVEERRARRAAAEARMTPEQRAQVESRRQAARERLAKMTPEERTAMRQRAVERRAQARPVATN